MRPASLSLPTAAVVHHPLHGLHQRDVVPVPIGVPVGSLEPERGKYLLLLQRQGLEGPGNYILRADWDMLTEPGDGLVWVEARGVPQDRDTLRVVLQVAIVVIAIVAQQYYAVPWLAAAVVTVGNIALNVFLPPKVPETLGNPGSVFSASLGGNTARLDEPIWKVCGRVKITPPFAAMPYVEFRPNGDGDATHNMDQFYLAIFAISEGSCTVEKAFIGKTSLPHFKDVIVAAVRVPGEQPVEALANVVTSTEVQTQKVEGAKVETDLAYYVGPFTASRPGDLVTHVGIDIAADQGLGGAGGESRTVNWRVEARPINDFGVPIGEWTILAEEARTDATATPQRWSNKYVLPAPMRPEVRVLRTDLEASEPQFRDSITWIGLRAYLAKPAPLNAHTTHYEVVMRASKQLSSQSQTDFSMIVRGECRSLNADLEWQPAAFTRNPAWWLLDLLTSSTWGLGLDDDRIDLQSFYDLARTCEIRQDHFDYAFTAGVNAWEALQTIAHVCRARVFRRGMVYTVARDEKIDMPVAALTHRNTQPGTMVLSSTLPSHEQPDGYVVQYQSNVTWDLAEVECPCPGFTVRNTDDPRYNAALPMMSRPVWMRLDGVTGYWQALREGTYQAASMAYRRQIVSCDTEMEGMLLAFMDPVRWQPRMVGYGQAGDVAFWDEATRVMGLTEPPDWSKAPLYLVLRRDDNTLTEPQQVTPGPTPYDVVLPEVPDFELVLDDGTRERPQFLLGPLNTSDEWVKISKIEDGGRTEGGAQLYRITGMVDHDAVHMADKNYLPGPGDVQDPIDSGLDYPDDDAGGGVGIIVRLSDHQVVGGFAGSGSAGGGAGVRFNANGQLVIIRRFDTVSPRNETIVPGEWITAAPIEPSVAGDYDVLVSDYRNLPAYPGGLQRAEDDGLTVTGTPYEWQSLDSDREFYVEGYGPVNDIGAYGAAYWVRLVASIRRRSTNTVLATRSIELVISMGPNDTGGA